MGKKNRKGICGPLRKKISDGKIIFCYLCKIELNQLNCSQDHVIPLSLLSLFKIRLDGTNIRPCCIRCNNLKGAIEGRIINFFKKHLNK